MMLLDESRYVLDHQRCQLKAGDEITLRFKIPEGEEPGDSLYKLRLRGDVALHPSWMYEGGYPLLYRLVDDSLSQNTHHSQYSLRIKSDGGSYPRRAYYKIMCPPRLTPQFPVPEGEGSGWTFSCWVSAEGFYILEGGTAEIRFETYRRKPGRDPRDISGEPDVVTRAAIPGGTYGWKAIGASLEIGEDTACILAVIEADKVSGTVYLEDPQLLSRNGWNILPQFTNTNPYHMFLNWMGENLSYREWTDIAVTVNGHPLPIQHLFQRCHKGSENEFPIPEAYFQAGENRITVRNANDYFAPHPYLFMRAEMLAQKKRPVKILYTPAVAEKDTPFSVLFSLAEDGEPVRIQVDGGSCGAPVPIPGGEHLACLSVIPDGDKPVIIHMEKDGYQEASSVERVVERGQDGVLTGTGDSIYIPQEPQRMQEFIIWYLHYHLGNFITFRPVYRWSGSRERDDACWELVRNLCSAARLYYCHIIDGRELPGINANPTKAQMESPYFIGNQGHERDGALYYWHQRKDHSNEAFFQEIVRKIHHHPDYEYDIPVIYHPDGVYIHFDPAAPRNMAEAAEQFVTRAGRMQRGIKRHTGPSVLFKYFFQAGLEVGGAELMYGPHEVVLSALRGASKAYHRDVFAAHLAVQWSTTPHDTPERYRRYQMALFICYLQGVHHINTEEGLYRMEEYFSVYDRFSDACLEHRKIQQEFTKFVQTHTRRGAMVNPVALLHGVNDGWCCFGRGNAWAHADTNDNIWKFSAPEESWDLLKVFYPDSVLDDIYCHPCPKEPVGFYSRTPYGTVDILPAEAGQEIFDGYGAMAFLGYNTASEEQVSRLISYVEAGGTLLLGWIHLITDTQREWFLRHFTGEEWENNPLHFAHGAEKLVGAHLEGVEAGGAVTFGRVQLSSTASVQETAEGHPLVIANRIGKGTVYLVNAMEFPAQAGVRPVYEKRLRQFGEAAVRRQQEIGWMTTKDTVGTAVYDGPDGRRTVYAVNTDWWSDEKTTASAVLNTAGKQIRVDLKRGVIHIFTLMDGIILWTADSGTDVIHLERKGNQVCLGIQGLGKTDFTIFAQGELESKDVQITRAGDGQWLCQAELSGPRDILFTIK